MSIDDLLIDYVFPFVIIVMMICAIILMTAITFVLLNNIFK